MNRPYVLFLCICAALLCAKAMAQEVSPYKDPLVQSLMGNKELYSGDPARMTKALADPGVRGDLKNLLIQRRDAYRIWDLETYNSVMGSSVIAAQYADSEEFVTILGGYMDIPLGDTRSSAVASLAGLAKSGHQSAGPFLKKALEQLKVDFKGFSLESNRAWFEVLQSSLEGLASLRDGAGNESIQNFSEWYYQKAKNDPDVRMRAEIMRKGILGFVKVSANESSAEKENGLDKIASKGAIKSGEVAGNQPIVEKNGAWILGGVVLVFGTLFGFLWAKFKA